MNNWIVVVDDDVLSLKNAKEILGAAGMRVGCLRSGRDLLEYLKKNTPDLILLDVLMPDMDGFETYQKLRQFEKEEDRKETPVIFLTGENNSESESRGLKAGASDYIKKPFDKDILIRRINNTVKNTRKIESLTEEASYDKLTGFLNKAAGTRKVSWLCAQERGALLVLDLDSFKLVNDMYGHDMGDRVLVAFAEVVKSSIRSEDVFSRIGGDEFMGFFPGMKGESSVETFAIRINEEFFETAKLLMGEDFGIPLGVSVGAAFAPECSKDYQELFRYADSALYKVKQNGKHGYAVYDPGTETVGDSNDLSSQLSRELLIFEERNDGQGKGAMILGRDAFTANYRLLIRYIKEVKGCACRLLFSLSGRDGEAPSVDAMTEFGRVLQEGLRSRDILLQCKGNQYLAVLPELKESEARVMVEHITRLWESTEYSDLIGMEYAISAADYASQE